MEGVKIRTEDDLRAFVENTFGIRIPDKQVCKEHTTPWRAFADAFFAKNSMSIWKASRGFGGKSFLLALLGLTESAALKVDVNVVGGSGEQAERVHEYMQRFWDYPSSPRHLLATDPTMRKTRLVFGNTVAALLASTRSVRGPHPARLRMDEIDEMDGKVFKAALGQTMSQRGVPPQTVLSSTHQYADATMTYALKLANERGWPVYQWCWRESVADGAGWLDRREVESKRKEIPASMWEAEYELQDPSPESRAIMEEHVRRMFDKSRGSIEGIEGEHIFEKPVTNARYVHGADWAKEVDWSVIVTFRVDVYPLRLVAYWRGQRLAWPRMVSMFDKRIEMYPRCSANHDNTGLGDVIDDYLEHPDVTTGINMVGKTRADMLSNYIAAIENDEFEAPYIEAMEGEHRLASNKDVYGSGHLPDTISAGALAYNAYKAGQGASSSDMQQHGHVEDYVSRWG